MNDNNTSIKTLRKVVASFIHKRDWEKFHTPKNIGMSIAIEAAELMEKFQWLSAAESKAINKNKKAVEQIGDELSDIVAYILSLCNTLDIDLASSFLKKMKKNELKYPAKRKGKNKR